MKKVVLALAAVAMVACFSFTSCSKKCTCKTPAGEVEYKLDELNDALKAAGFKEIDKCSDEITWEAEGMSISTGWSCE